MALIEYCDNTHCLYNQSYSCTAEEVVFDDNACCITARYSDEASLKTETNNYEPPVEPTPPPMQDNDWIKYI